MKKLCNIFTCTFCLICLLAFDANTLKAQQADVVYTIVEEMPEPEGGISKMMEFIGKNIIYPIDARKMGIGGKVFLKFVIEETGKMTDLTVIKSSGLSSMDQEAIRVVLSFDKPWKPGKQNGKPVKVYYNLPINFTLDEPYYVINVTSSNVSYKEFCKLLLDGQLKEIEERVKKFDGNSDDCGLLYNYAVVEFNKDKKHFCKLMRMAQAQSDMNSIIRNLSSKYLSQYCN